MYRRILIVICILMGLGSYTIQSYGQVDLSSQFLLRKSVSSIEDESFESGRYSRTGRKSQNIQKRVLPKAKLAEGRNVKSTIVKKQDIEKIGPKNKPLDPKITNIDVKQEYSEFEIIQELMPSRGIKATRKYFSKIDKADRRRNILEIQASPLYFYTDSDSNFWHRDYRSFGPGLGLGATVWFSPFLGLTTDIKSSLSSDIVGNAAGTNRLPADHLWVDVGIVFRRFSSFRKNSSIVRYGLGFRDYSMKIPSDSTERVNVNSSGILLSIELKAEPKNGIRKTWGVEMVPKAGHIESYASVDIQSGNDNETNIIGLWIGEEYEFTRKQTVYWKLKHTFEKNLFGGSANVADPETGVAPQGVVVNQSSTFIQLGISFAN